MPELLLTVPQAANRLQLKPATIQRQLKRGELRGIKRGKMWRIPESALTEVPAQSAATAENLESPLARALAMVLERDARSGFSASEHGTFDAAAEIRAMREAQTP